MNIRVFLRTIDSIGGTLLTKLLPARSAAVIPHGPNRIIFIKLWALGESVLTLPALQAYKTLYPNTAITVLTTTYNAPIFQNQPCIDHVVSGNLFAVFLFAIRNIRNFDLAIDGEPYAYISAFFAYILGKTSIGFATCGRDLLFSNAISYNDAQHARTTYGDLFGISVGHLVPISYSKQDIATVTTMLGTLGIPSDARLVIIAPTVGGSAQSRMWKRGRFASVAQQLLQDPSIRVIYIGSSADSAILQRMHQDTDEHSVYISTFTISQSAYLASISSLVIANDSGYMHIAASMDVPVLGLFGPNTPIRFAPANNVSQSIYHPCSTSPHIHVHEGVIPDTLCGCMDAIQVTEVLDIAHHMLSSYTQ